MSWGKPEIGNESDRVLRVCIPPDACHVPGVRKTLAGFARRHHVASRDLDTLLLAVGEAVANAVEHSETIEDVEIQCRIDEREIIATIIDSGRGVDRSAIDRIVPLPEPMSEGGRGIPLMQRCTDMFSLRRLPGGGTAVVLGLLRRIQENGSAS